MKTRIQKKREKNLLSRKRVTQTYLIQKLVNKGGLGNLTMKRNRNYQVEKRVTQTYTTKIE